MQHIVAVKVDLQRALAILVIDMDLAAGDLLQRGLHLDGALGAGEVILDLGRLGGLGQLIAARLGLADIQDLRNALGGGLPHQLLAGQPQQDLGVAEA